MRQPTAARAWDYRRMMRGVSGGMLACLLALLWLAGRPPIAHASGVPYCPNPLPDEHAPNRPAIHLSRTEGPVGTNLTVGVRDWRPGARVALHFDARDPQTGELYVLISDVAQGVVATDGAVTLAALDAPAFFCMDMYANPNIAYQFDQSGGTTGYFVLAASDGEVSAPVAFRYLPAPTVALGGLDTHGYAKVGAAITVSGSGWEPREPLTLTLQSDDPTGPSAVSYAAQTHAASDGQGDFTTSYPLDARLRWDVNVQVVVTGSGPRFGTLDEGAYLSLMPAIQPTFQVDRTLVTPGMTITVSGAHWYPGDALTIKYCDAQLGREGWVNGPDCGKAINPTLGTATIDVQGRMEQQFQIPRNQPLGVIMLVTDEIYTGGYGVPPIAVHVVSHLPTWDDIHPRVAALRNKLVGSLPFTIPALLLLGALTFFAYRRWRTRRPVAGG